MENRLYLLDTTCLLEKELFDEWYDRMDTARKNKIDALKVESGKRLSLGAGILMNKALKEAGIDEYEVVLAKNDKPYIKGRSDVFYNISHSGNMVVLGISDKEIGVDIERCKRFKDSLVKYVFSEGEIEFAGKLSDKMPGRSEGEGIQREDVVYTRFWTIKESIMKHSGMGISLEPKKIKIYSEDGVIKAEAEKYDCSGLNLFSYDEKDYQITVCSQYDHFPEITKITL